MHGSSHPVPLQVRYDGFLWLLVLWGGSASSGDGKPELYRELGGAGAAPLGGLLGVPQPGAVAAGGHERLHYGPCKNLL